jgi:hypothetical protein
VIGVICVDGGGNAAPLQDFGVFGEYLVIFSVMIACFGEYRFMLAGGQLRILM